MHRDSSGKYYGQETPYDQICAIASGALGHASNMQNDRGDPKKQIQRISGALEEILHIYRTYHPKEWMEKE